MQQQRQQSILLAIGDALIFFVSLTLVLIARYGLTNFSEQLDLHAVPFATVFLIWLLIFYIVDLYDPIGFAARAQIAVRVARAMLVGGVIAISLFYLIPQFVITPRTNLIIHVVLSTTLLILWRFVFVYVNTQSQKIPILIIGDSPAASEIRSYIQSVPVTGYNVINCPKHISKEFIEEQKILIVIADKKNTPANLSKLLFSTLPTGVRFVDLPTFYERLFGKIPVSEISEVWFLENIAEREKRLFEIGKRFVDISFSLIIGFGFLILLPFVAALIKLTSAGPVFYRQIRVGYRGKHFLLVKFRTMIVDAEKNGAQFATVNDVRITPIGKILRKTRIDELPQVLNVLKGELSFIGPRPERPEIIADLEREIPFYDVRLLIRPGLSGWAQINPPYYYGTNAESLLKVQYDLFYIKNRNAALDLSIALKTLSVMISRSGR